MPPIQMNFDVCLALGILLLPVYLYLVTYEKFSMSYFDMLMFQLMFFWANIGSVLQTLALNQPEG